MEEKTPYTVTVRRNPHRRARPTPGSTLPLPLPSPPQSIPSFPLQDILDIEIPQNPPPPTPTPTENLKVFLRIRPLTIPSSSAAKDRNAQSKNAWPKNPKPRNGVKPKCRNTGNSCIAVRDANSITVSPPLGLQDSKRMKSEVYEGFDSVFASQSTQVEVYEKLLKPLVDDFLKCKSGMLAAVGPSGSGKTHTMFGCVREPGMVPLALKDIFSSCERKPGEEPRTLYMSMFEISSEKGKSERISDLLQGVPDLSKQHSTVKGVQQIIIQNAHQAEILLASGLLKRATAGTNTNSQSSRSQCIINFQQPTREVDDQDAYSELTIVDLAGAEREKRTGNQGTRLLESNFINNTSMVFGLCLRALLEHQKNPKRQLQKHFQNSMLTRYLRDYLEGKKRMSLILTVKPSEEDYLDTSFVLRQAAPYMQIKFSNVEQPNNFTSKRPLQTLNRAEPLKRKKHPRLEAREIKYEKILGDPQVIEEGHDSGGVEDANLFEISINSEEFSSVSLKKRLQTFTEADRNYKVLEGLSKAIWKVLKEYNKKLKETQQENCILNAELVKERKRCLDLESSIQDVKFRCSCWKKASESNIYDHENLQKAHAGTSSGNVNHRPNRESSDQHTESCLQSREGLDKTIESYSSGENENHFIDKLKAAAYCSDEEACISSVSGTLPLTIFDDSGDTEDCISAGTSSDRPYRETSDRHTKSCNRSCEGLDKTTESYSSGENKIPFIDKLKATVYCSDEEACISPVADVLPLTNVSDSEDSVNQESPSACVPSNVMVEISKRCSPQAGTSSENVNYRSNHEASDKITKSCLWSCEGLNKTTESYGSGKNKNHFLDKLEAVVNCSDEEACISSVSDVHPLTNFDDSGESLDFKNVTDVRREHMHHNDQNLTTGNTTDLEINKLADSAAPFSDSSRENFALCEEEKHLTSSSNLESAVSSSQSPNSTTKNRSLLTEDKQLEKIYESLVLRLAGTSTKDATLNKKCDNNNVSVAAGISSQTKDSQNLSKPKRRLLPVSSLLLKDMSSLVIEDETDKRKGGRVDKKVGFDENKTQSKTSLLQILQRNVVR